MRNSFRTFSSALLLATLSLAGVAARADGAYAIGSLGSPDYRGGVNGVGGGGDKVGVQIGGGYEITPNFALEGGYYSLGRSKDVQGTVNVRGLYVDAVGTLEVAPRVSVFGSVGAAEGHFSTTAGDDTSPALKLGAGLQYALTPSTAVRLGYQQYRFSNAFDSQPHVGETVVGLKIGF